MAVISDPEVWLQTVVAAGIPPMRARGPIEDAFQARLRTQRLGSVRLAEFVTPSGECFRDEPGVREADQDFCQLYLTYQGHTRLEQSGRQADLGRGDMAVIDPARPLSVTTSTTRYLTVLIPRRMLGVDDLRPLAGRRIPASEGSGALLSCVVRAAVRSSGRFGPEEAARSGTAIAELTTALLSTQLPRQSPDDSLRTRIRAHVAVGLHDPALSPASVAAAHHISVRRLHQLFRGEPFTVAALIRHSRLERCRLELADSTQTAATVARRWGFTDPAHFSRLFKAAYGCTASEYRQSTALISN